MKNIVFSGGAFKCWAYIGTLQALYEHKTPDVEHVVGVSGGSFFGLLFVLKFPWEVLLNFFMNVNFKEYFDIDIDNVLTQQSLFAGNKFTHILKEVISYIIDPDVTFMELRKFTSIKLTINAMNITDGVLEYFNYQLTPDVKVVDAIRASSSLPFIFPPYQINNKLYYDGGICNNCPVDILDEVDTIGFDVCMPSKTDTNYFALNLLLRMSDILNKDTSKQRYNIFYILDETFNNETMNLNQSRDDIFNIYMNGYINSKNILFTNYKALTL